jgi:hypothetical protein
MQKWIFYQRILNFEIKELRLLIDINRIILFKYLDTNDFMCLKLV